MKKETIRSIDVVLGSVICWLLTGLRRVRDLFPPRHRGPPRRIVFLKLIEQGATVIAAPALIRAAQRVGRENLFFCVFAENRPILDLLDLVPPDNVLPMRHGSLLEFAWDSWVAIRRLRAEDVDTAIDMEFFARAPAILAWLSGATHRVGLFRFTSEGPYRGDLLTHRVPHNPYLHTAQAYLVLVDALDADPRERPLPKVLPEPDPRPPRFEPRPEEITRIEGLLAELPPTPMQVILNPNTGDLLPLRMWPTDRFVTLGRRLLAEHEDLSIIITGAPSEKDGAMGVARAIGSSRVLCLAGRTSLRDVLVLYTLCDVLVTNDSGPGHFASMTDIDNIVLFGPETPALFGPLGSRGHPLWAGLACSPCVNAFNHRFSPCTNNRCMQEIPVEAVQDVVNRCLRERAAPLEETA